MGRAVLMTRRKSVLFLATILACATSDARSTTPTLTRTFTPRSSLPQRYAKCGQRLHACASVAQDAGKQLLTDALRSNERAQLLRLDLAFAHAKPAVLDRVIRTLAPSLEVKARPVDELVDLSAALLLRYSYQDRTEDLLQALEASLAAVERAPENAAGRFNLALSASQAHLSGTASQAWRDYIALDATSGWADEAREHLGSHGPIHSEHVSTPSSRSLDAPRADPQADRERVMDVLLGEWANAVQASAFWTADSIANEVRTVKTSLGDSARDGSVARLAVSLPVVSSRDAGARLLADAVAAFDAAQRAYTEARYDEAANHYQEVLRSQAPAVLRAWSKLGAAASALYLTTPTAALPLLKAAEADAGDELPALRGRALWLIGTALLREGRQSDALAYYRRAVEMFERCAEVGNAAATTYLLGETWLALGNLDEAGHALEQALHRMAARPPSVWRHNSLMIFGKLASAHGYRRTAALVADEDVQTSQTLAPIYRAEALLSRARSRASSVLTDLNSAQELLQAVPDGTPRRWLTAQANTVRAVAAGDSRPARLSLLDSAVRFFERRSATRWLPAVTARAAMLLEDGRYEDAVRDLRAARAVLESERQRIAAEGTRVQLVNSVRQTYEALAAALVGSGDTTAALRAIEELRTPYRDGSEASTRRSRKGDDVAVTLAMSGDTLYAWIERGGTLRLIKSQVDRDRFEQRVLSTRSEMEVAGAEALEIDRNLRALYEIVIAPIEPAMRDASRLHVGVSGILSAVPFAALTSPDGQYMIERWPIIVGAIARGDHPQPRLSAARAHALLIAPSNAYSERWGAPLRATEANSLRRAFPRNTVLEGSAALAGAVATAMPSAGVVHFAGHSVGDVRSPGDGFIVLARDRDGTDTMSGADIARLNLRHVQLVVLAACESGVAFLDRSADAIPLTRAFQAAGAQAVVGSLWRVADDATGELLSKFYDAVGAGEEPVGALRTAQLAMLRSPNRNFRSPAAWSGFTISTQN